MRQQFLALSLLPALALGQSAFDFRQVDEALRESVSPFNPGLSLTLVVDGDVVYRKAFGNFQSDRAVPIASATKWYSAATILTLVDSGLLRLDEPVSVRLASFRGTPKAAITLRQLLSHTSGLQGDLSCLHDGSPMVACVDIIAAAPLLFAPGARFSYGNTSMQVAGRLAEVATGKSWNQIFRERLAGPLGMSCTTLDALGPNPAVAFSAVSCEADYGKFLVMLLAGGAYGGVRVLSPASVAEMMRDQTNGVPILESIYSDYGNLDAGLPGLRYGLGTWRERVSTVSGEAQELGSQGATGFSPWIDRERNVAGILSTESTQAAIMPAYLAVKEAVRRAVPAWASRGLLVTSAASYRLGPVAPGEVITIFGQGIGPAAASVAQPAGGIFPHMAGGTRILFDGQPGALLYASWGQISVVAPFSIEGKDRVVVQVQRDGQPGPRVTMAVASSVPGVFQHGASRGVVLNQDATLNSPENPAKPGSIIVLYATGGGQTNPAASDGQLQGVSSLRAIAGVTVGGEPAVIHYAGGAPGLIAGTHQINARLSPDTPAGAAVPLVLTIGGSASPPVTVSVE